jgi:tetratricopeptide (TPR) repeat protein
MAEQDIDEDTDQDTGEIGEAIRVARGVVEATCESHMDRAERLRQLADLLLDRGKSDDVKEAIRLKSEAIEINPQAVDLSDLSSLHDYRYFLTGDVEHIEEAIKLEKSAIDISLDDQERAARMVTLSGMIREQYKGIIVSAHVKSIIRAGKEPGNAMVNDPDRVRLFSEPETSGGIHEIYDTVLMGIESAISLNELAIETVSDDYPDRSDWFSYLTILYQDRYQMTRIDSHLEEAVEVANRSLELSHTRLPEVLLCLGQLLIIRYLKTRKETDIEEAVELIKEAFTTSTPDSFHACRANLADALFGLYKRTDAKSYLDEAIRIANEQPRKDPGVISVGEDSFFRLIRCDFLAMALFDRYQHNEDLADLDEAIEFARKLANELFFSAHLGSTAQTITTADIIIRDWWYRQAGTLCPDNIQLETVERRANIIIGNLSHVETLGLLKRLLRCRYIKTGNLRDVEELVQTARHIVDLKPTQSNLIDLGFLLLELYKQTQDHEIINETTEIAKRLEIFDESDEKSNQVLNLHYLAVELSARSNVSGDEASIEEAIRLEKQAISLVPNDHHQYAAFSNSLGVLYSQKYNVSKTKTYIERSLENLWNAVNGMRSDDTDRANYLRDYAVGLLQAYQFSKSSAELDKAIQVARQATNESSASYPMRETILDVLAIGLYQRCLTTGSTMGADLDEAISTERQAVKQKRESALGAISYSATLASLLCERHVLTGSAADLEEAAHIASVVKQAMKESGHVHPYLAMIPCYFGVQEFKCFFDIDHKDAQIALWENQKALNATANDQHLDRALALSGLALELSRSSPRQLASLDEAVQLGRKAVEIAESFCSENISWHLLCLAMCLIHRVNFGVQGDVAETITTSRKALQLLSKDHPSRSVYLMIHAISLHGRYSLAGRLSDLHDCIYVALEAWDACRLKTSSEDRRMHLLCLGNLRFWFGERYLREGNVTDLQRATQFRQGFQDMKETGYLSSLEDMLSRIHLNNEAAVPAEGSFNAGRRDIVQNTLQRDVTAYPTRLHNFVTQVIRPSFSNADEDLSIAISLGRIAVMTTPCGHMRRPSRLEFLGECLELRHTLARDKDIEEVTILYQRKNRETTDLDEAIKHFQEIVGTMSKRCEYLFSTLHRLGPLYYERFRYLGDLGDLKMALLAFQESANVSPKDDCLRPCRLLNLGAAWKSHYDMFKMHSDLEAAMRAFQEAVGMISAHSPIRRRCLAHLASVYYAMYESQRDLDDLETALQLYGDAINSMPDNFHEIEDLVEISNSLGHAYLETYKASGKEMDFERATQGFHKAADYLPPDSPSRVVQLVDLANCYIVGYSMTTSTKLLHQARQVLQSAAHMSKTIPLRDYIVLFTIFGGLGNCYQILHNTTESESDLDFSIVFLREAYRIVPADDCRGLVRYVLIAKSLISALILAKKWNEAYRVALEIIPMVPKTTPRFLDVSETQSFLTQYSSLACDAGALILTAGQEPTVAMEYLEKGRAVAVAAFSQLRVNVDLVARSGDDRREELRSLCAQLEDLPVAIVARDQSLPSVSFEENGGGRDALVRLSQRITASKKLDEFILRFQTIHKQIVYPTAFHRGMMGHSTTGGCIVLVNVSYRCDAFFVKGYTCRSLPLPNLSRKSIQERVEKGDFQSLPVLEWLWDTIAGPVLDVLGYNETPCDGAPWPHIWWVLTGPLSKFPIHAAGHHTKSSDETVMDRVISSYSPSIRALFETERLGHTLKDNELKGRKSKPGSHKPLQALVVSMEDTPHSTFLPYAGEEVTAVSEVCELMSVRPIRHDHPQKSVVLSSLRECEIFHFAGHTYTDRQDPSQSHLRLQDWTESPLTVADIVAMNLRGRLPFLAYLSTCGSGQIEDAKHLDESMHLTSAFQLAGFRHVIGTLWEVKDSACVDMARLVYDGILSRGFTDEAVSWGLHNAVRQLRDQWRQALTGTGEPGTDRGKSRQDKASLPTRNAAHGSSTRNRLYGENELSRDATLCIDEPDQGKDSDSLQWVAYVHYGV